MTESAAELGSIPFRNFCVDDVLIKYLGDLSVLASWA